MPFRTLFYNCRLITPERAIPQGWLLTDDDRIALIGSGDPPKLDASETIDAQGRTALPGFIDLHVHGGVGLESMDASAEALAGLAKFYAQHGVTGFLATTWTAPADQIEAALRTIAQSAGRQDRGATLLGAHLEGPYLNPARCGAQDSRQIRRAESGEAMHLLELNVIKLAALAPEYPENHWLISECIRRGVTVSAAHTAATYDEMQYAVRLGLTQTTHTFNAMTGLNHRQPGTVGAALDLKELRCELISDNVHVHPAAMRILYAAKGVDGIILITDATRGAGLPSGTQYEQDGRRVIVGDESVCLEDGTLAGSKLTMDRAVSNFMRATGQPLETIWHCSSLNAARSIHMSHRKGSLEVGKDADIILVDGDINVYLTMAEGRIVYQGKN